MYCIRGRGRNTRILGAVIFFIITLFYLEYDSTLTRTGNQPQFIVIRNKYLYNMSAERRPQSCSEKTNFVYLKMIKCASTTLATMFRRFGYTRDLSFVLPVQKHIYLGWPYPMEDDHYRPKKSVEFNILVDHVVYNRSKLSKLMPNNTLYITSIREPFSQFKSMFHYYNLQNITEMHSSSPISEYLRNLDKWESRYKSSEYKKLRFCIPDGFSMSKNLMSFNLGFPTGFHPGTLDKSQDPTFVKQWLDDISSEFALVLISEYLHESLVLLRRLMCWSLKDIVYYSLNVGAYNFHTQHDADLIQIYRNWSNVDYILYDHFNKTLWKKLASQSADFWQEVEYFRKIITEVSRYCGSFPTEIHQSAKGAKQVTIKRKIGHPRIILTVQASYWNEEFSVSEQTCLLLQDELIDIVKAKYDTQKPDIPQPKPSVKFC